MTATGQASPEDRQEAEPVVGGREDHGDEAGHQAPTFDLIVAVIQIALVAVLAAASTADKSTSAESNSG